MRKLFTGILATIVIVFGLLVVAGSAGTDSILGEIIINALVAMFCAAPFAIVGLIAIRINAFIESRRQTKKKHDFIPDGSYDDACMQDIMNKLSPQDRAYLQRRLADNEVGFGDDGELISMEDLLNEFEEKSKRG